MTVNELKRLMMLNKKADKIKADVLMLLLDNIQKKAKEEKRTLIDSDIVPAARRMLKMANQSKEAGIDVDYEIEILKSFLPYMLSYDEISVAVVQIMDDLGFEDMGIIMKALKSAFRDSMDMKVASVVVKERIKYFKGFRG